MASDAGPTLSDDEATLAQYAEQLGDAFTAIARGWLVSLVEARIPGLSADAEVSAQLDAGASTTAAEFRQLLQMDIATQPSGPLEILRRAIRFPTEVLTAHDVAAVPRDEFAMTNFPDDVYNLTPASFADVDPSLHGPGLLWGAAKAHVHLRRRREAVSRNDGGQVVVLSADLIDRSKISAAYPAAVFVRSPAKLAQAAEEASLVLVDLSRFDDPAALLGIEARTVAFGSHVDDEALAAAESAGAEALPRSVFFRRLESGEV